jgi:hypothetical protein
MWNVLYGFSPQSAGKDLLPKKCRYKRSILNPMLLKIKSSNKNTANTIAIMMIIR